jgi:hypothetical protein
MFRRRQDDEDPFAALNEANARGEARIAGGDATTARPSGDSTSSRASAGGATRPRPDPIVRAQAPSRAGGPVASAPAGVPGAPRQRRNGPLVLLTVVAAVAASGALVVFSASPADDRGGRVSGEQRGDGGSSSSSGSGGSGGDKQDGGTQAEHADLVEGSGFGGALAEIRDELRRGERVWLLRVARDRVNALTRLPNGDQRSIDVDDSFGVRVTDSGSAGSHRGIPLSRISALAPSLATTLAARQAGISERKLDYLVMTTPILPGGKADWQIFFRDVRERDRHFSASLDGMKVRRPGEGSTTSSTLRITTNGRTRTISGAQAERISACIRRAGSDGARIQRCLP